MDEAAKPLSKLNRLRRVRFEFAKVLVSIINDIESYKYLVCHRGVEYDPTTHVEPIRQQFPNLEVKVVVAELPHGWVYIEGPRVTPLVSGGVAPEREDEP